MMAKAMLGRLVAALAGAIFLVGAGSAAQADTWRIATLAPDGSGWMKVLGKGASEIEKATAGRVKLKYYTSGVQGDEKDVVRKMNMGGLDGGALTSTGLALIDESIKVLELPMLFESVEELDYVRKKMWPTFEKRFAKKGYKLGDPGDVGFIYFYSANPVDSADDLAKQKVWMWAEDPIVRAMFKKLGVNGVPLGVPDVLAALSTGRINAAYGSPLSTVALQWYTKIRYSTSMPMSYGIAATVIKMDKWNAMSAADRKNVQKILDIQGRLLRKQVRRDNKRAFKAMTRSGVKVVETPAAMVADFTKKAEQVWNELAGKVYSKQDLAQVLKYRAEFRAKK